PHPPGVPARVGQGLEQPGDLPGGPGPDRGSPKSLPGGTNHPGKAGGRTPGGAGLSTGPGPNEGQLRGMVPEAGPAATGRGSPSSRGPAGLPADPAVPPGSRLPKAVGPEPLQSGKRPRRQGPDRGSPEGIPRRPGTPQSASP